MGDEMKTTLIRSALKKLLKQSGYYRLSVQARLHLVHYYIFEVR